MLHYSGINKFFKFFLNKKIYVLNYHSVSSNLNSADLQGEFYKHLSIKNDLFEDHLRMMIKNGHTFIQPRDLLGDEIIKLKKPTILYFDDGFKDNLVNALPILQKFNIKASVFVSPNIINEISTLWTIKHRVFLKSQNRNPKEIEKIISDLKTLPKLERENFVFEEYLGAKFHWPLKSQNIFLNWQDLKILVDEGWEIGSHSMSHSDLSELDREEIEKELFESKEEIEKKLDASVTSFSYPHGRISELANKMFLGMGYKIIVSVGQGLNTLPSVKKLPIYLKTVPVKVFDSANMLELKLYSRHFLRS